MNKYGLLIIFSISFSQQIYADSVLYSDEPIKNPWTALTLSSILPGAGQYYNESYIKTGIILTGFTYFLIEAIDYNQKITDLNATNLKMVNFPSYKARLDSYYDSRNVAIWRLLAVYTYNVLDAYIGAYLFGFDEIMGDERNSSSSFHYDHRDQTYYYTLSVAF